MASRKLTERESRDSIHFILDTVQSKDLFRLVNFLPASTFASLIWYNPNNYTGYRVWEDLDDAPREQVAPLPLSHAQKEIVTVWSLAQLLPASLADYFDAFVVSFLQKPLQFREQLADVTSRDETLAKETEFLRRYVKGDLATELIRSVGPARTLKRRSPSSSSRATPPSTSSRRSCCSATS